MDYQRIPPMVLTSINDWAREAIPPGDYVRALLCNDLAGAFQRADPHSLAAIYETVSYLCNHAPRDCWGSEAHYLEWPQHVNAMRADAERWGHWLAERKSAVKWALGGAA